MTWYISRNNITYIETEIDVFIKEHSIDLSTFAGFVYLITEKDSNMKYIGKKFFWSKVTKPPLKGKKNKRRSLKESDWRDYYGSNELLKENVIANGVENYRREILRLCKTKGECSYYEAKCQFDHDALLRDDYYNRFIGCKIHASHVGK
jgi:hypothetical protein|tara:strand:+ start:805 stop:1251 length:447 start_codon:yes stop_codon:yes gene_type:complete